MNARATLSERARRMPASPIRRLAPLAADARRRGRTVFPLNIGQPDIPTPDQILERLRGFDERNVAYGPSEGLPEFIEAVRGYYERSGGPRFASDEIFVTTGGSEALLFVFAAIADHGDEVIVFEPFYTNYSGFAGLVGVRTIPVTTRVEDGYHLPDDEALERARTPRTRAVVLCSPNNPTGTVYGRDELERVAGFCERHGLFLVSDEVYREFTYDGATHVSAMDLGIDDRVIVTDSLSKRVSMCGARVGWIATRHREVLDAVLRFGQARLCPPTLGQYAGVGLRDVPDQYMRDVIREYQQRRDVVYDAMRQTPGVELRRPEGAFYVCARLPVDDAGRFAEFMLRDFELDGETVMIAPAEGFYATPGLGRQEARVAYVLEEAALLRAMRALAAGLAAYR